MSGGNYRSLDDDIWQGRIDSEINYDSFRWHQWVEMLDLKNSDIEPFAGELGFAFVGYCSDAGIRKNKGRVGAANGPACIREALANLPCFFSKEVKLFDAGNIYCENISLEECQQLLSEAIIKVLDLNLVPIVLGGGHELALGHYNGVSGFLSRNNKRPKIGIINFDAHLDIRPYPDGGNSGTMFRQIYDMCASTENQFSYLCLGAQQHCNTIELFKTANTIGVEYILAKDMINGNILDIVNRVNDYIKQQDYIYLTICSDVFSSAFAPGVSASQPLGLDPENVLLLLKFILRSKKVVSFDIAEVSSRFDQDNTTSNLAAVIIFTLANTMASLFDLLLEF